MAFRWKQEKSGMDFVELVFGAGPDLEVWQMSARAVVIFFFALALIRTSGRRSFGQHIPFDACISVLLGAVLSRAVVGASPFWATVASATVLVLAHRGVALACTRWQWVENLVAGREIEVVTDGQIHPAKMRQALLTRQNLDAAIRQSLGRESLADVKRAIFETDGSVSVIGRP